MKKCENKIRKYKQIPIKPGDYFQNEVEINDENNFYIPETISDLLYNSIARIEIKEEKKISTGFFIRIDINKKKYNFLLTCHHSISQENVDSKIIIYIFFGKAKEEKKINIKLDIKKRFIKCLKKYDATIIEILDEDNISDDKYLLPDLNYAYGFTQYIDNIVYTCGYPNVQTFKGERHLSSGKIKAINEDYYRFTHTCDTRKGSSGSSLISNNKRVIGFHFGSDKEGKINYGYFIGKIIDKIKLIILKNKEEKIKMFNIYKKKEIGKNNINIIDGKLKFQKSKIDINKENKKEKEEKNKLITNNKNKEKLNEKKTKIYLIMK